MATQQYERNTFGANAGDSAKSAASKAGDMAKDTAHKAGEMAKDTANKAGEMARDTADKAGDLAKDLASRAGEAVKGAASAVAQKTGEAATYVGHKADDASASIGSGVKSFADTIREKGPHGGMLGAADAAVANTLETCGNELEQGLGVMAEDLTNTIRRHPIPAVLIGVGIGYLAARAFSK